MSKEIEDFIRNNKQAFDTETPGENLWFKMEQELNKREKKEKVKKLGFGHWISIAATLLVVVGIAFMYNLKQQANNTLAQVNPAQAEKQVHFSSIIAQKTDSLGVYAADNPELYQKFTTDLERIQADYNEYIRSNNMHTRNHS